MEVQRKGHKQWVTQGTMKSPLKPLYKQWYQGIVYFRERAKNFGSYRALPQVNMGTNSIRGYVYESLFHGLYTIYLMQIIHLKLTNTISLLIPGETVQRHCKVYQSLQVLSFLTENSIVIYLPYTLNHPNVAFDT